MPKKENGYFHKLIYPPLDVQKQANQRSQFHSNYSHHSASGPANDHNNKGKMHTKFYSEQGPKTPYATESAMDMLKNSKCHFLVTSMLMAWELTICASWSSRVVGGAFGNLTSLDTTCALSSAFGACQKPTKKKKKQGCLEASLLHFEGGKTATSQFLFLLNLPMQQLV